MSAARSSSGLRVLVGLFVTIAFFTYFSSSDADLRLTMNDKTAARPIPGIDVSLKQTQTSPPTVTVKVTNTNSEPVTILQYASPLDGLALQLGLLSIVPDGASTPLEIPTLQVRRKWPPDAESLITIEPGQSQEQEIVLREPVVSEEDLGKKARVQLKGTWEAVWAKKKADITKESLNDVRGSKDVYSGKFLSNSLEITTE